MNNDLIYACRKYVSMFRMFVFVKSENNEIFKNEALLQ